MQPVSYHHHHLPVSLGSGGSEDSVCSMAFPPIYLAVLPPNQTAVEVPHQGRCSPILVGQTPVKGRISPLPAVPQVQVPGTDQVPSPVQGMQVIILGSGEGHHPGQAALWKVQTGVTDWPLTGHWVPAVSYTHLTLPTILRV